MQWNRKKLWASSVAIFFSLKDLNIDPSVSCPTPLVGGWVRVCVRERETATLLIRLDEQA